MVERTLILVKPDGVQRGHVGEIITRFERKGLKLVGLKMLEADDTILNAHYEEHLDKSFFADLKRFMKSSPIVAMVWEGGAGTVAAVRMIVGPTKGHEAPAGTIRGDFTISGANNLVHASDSIESGKTEVGRFFTEEEILNYEKTDYVHVYGE